ncbi:MAG: adenylyl-sulfate kinase [Bryobacteraceae bacterium]
MERSKGAFAVWITGLPASGKSTIAAALKAQLAERDVDVVVLESDVLRKVLARDHDYKAEGRDTFYQQLGGIGALLVEQGVPVIFDATANRRAHRDRARQAIGRFIEVYVDVPLATCQARDPKGIYRSAAAGQATNVPGLQDPYEPPEAPDVLLEGGAPGSAAQRIIQKLIEKGYVK